MSNIAVKQWVNNAHEGAKFDTGVIDLMVNHVAEVKADGKPMYFGRVASGDKTAYSVFRGDVITFLDSLIRAECGKAIDIAFPRRKCGRANPAYSRLRSLRDNVVSACAKAAGITKPTKDEGEADLSGTIDVPASPDERQVAMNDEALSIATTLLKFKYSGVELIAILQTAIEAIELAKAEEMAHIEAMNTAQANGATREEMARMTAGPTTEA